MDDRVRIEIEVTREAARALADDDDRRRRVGEFVSKLVQPRTQEEDPLLAIFRETQRAAEAVGLTEAEIDTELSIYNAERRH